VVEEKDRKVLIITDGADSIQQMAENIAAIIEGDSAYSVKTMDAESFAGNDLLPCCAFFLGCESPKPSSFSYLETLFQHINMVGRPCGLFSSNDQAVKYLSSLVTDSEAVTGSPLLAKDNAIDRDALHNWVQGNLKTA